MTPSADEVRENEAGPTVALAELEEARKQLWTRRDLSVACAVATLLLLLFGAIRGEMPLDFQPMWLRRPEADLATALEVAIATSIGLLVAAVLWFALSQLGHEDDHHLGPSGWRSRRLPQWEALSEIPDVWTARGLFPLVSALLSIVVLVMFGTAIAGLVSPWAPVIALLPTIGLLSTSGGDDLSPVNVEARAIGTEPVEAPDAAEEQLTPFEWWTGLRDSPIYRGQVVDQVSRTETPERTAPLPDRYLSIVRELSIDQKIYEQTAQALQRQAEPPGDQEVIITVATAPPGDGSRTTAMILTVEAVCERFERVLVLVPNHAHGRNLKDELDEVFRRSPRWSTIVRVHHAADPSQQPHDADVVILTPEALDSALKAFREPSWNAFFRNLGLIEVVDASHLVGVRAAHAGMLFRRLELLWRQSGVPPRFFVECWGVRSPESFVTDLLGEAVVGPTIDIDAAPKTAVTFAAWIPTSRETETGSRVLQRDSMIEDARTLARSAAAESFDVLFVVDARGLSNQDVQGIGSRIDPTMLGAGEIEVVDSLSATRRSITEYDVLVYAGSGHLRWRLEQAVTHLGADREFGNAVCVLVCSQDGSSVVRLPARVKRAGELPLGLVEFNNRHLVELHTRAAVGMLPVPAEAVDRTLGPVGKQFITEQLRAGQLELWASSGGAHPTPTAESWFRPSIAFDSFGEGVVRVINTANRNAPIRDFDRQRVLQASYRGALMLVGGNRYEVEGTRLLDEPPTVEVVGADQRNGLYTSRIAVTEVEPLKMPSVRRERIGGGWGRASAQIKVAERVVGFRVADGNDPLTSVKREPTLYDTPLEASAYLTKAEVLIPPGELAIDQETLHALSHAIRRCAPLLFTHDSESLGTTVQPEIEGISNGPALVLYDAVPGGIGLAEELVGEMPRLFDLITEMLLLCPCQDGCLGCLSTPNCKRLRPGEHAGEAGVEAATLGLNKRGLLEALLDLMPNKTAERSIEQRYQATAEISEGPTWLLGELYAYRFQDVLGISLKNKGQPRLKFLDDNEREELLGTYDGDAHEIRVRRMTERETLGTLAHELAHAWEYHGDGSGADIRAFQSRPGRYHVAMEGFAQWVEFRILDHYGFHRELDEILSRTPDAYGFGFRVFLELENQQGVAGVVEWMRNPNWDWLDEYERNSPQAAQDLNEAARDYDGPTPPEPEEPSDDPDQTGPTEPMDASPLALDGTAEPSEVAVVQPYRDQSEPAVDPYQDVEG